MIKNIILKNFQIHEHLELNFSKGVNAITGETDAGKSAIIRALNLLLNNTPRGGEKLYHTDLATEPLQITLHDDKGNTIDRKNRTYTINKKTQLTAFKQDKPEAISEIIRVNRTNFQFQIDPHFMILETGGNAAKDLNAISGMEDQMFLLAETKIRISSIRNLYEECTKKKEHINANIAKLKDAPALLKKLEIVILDQSILAETEDSISILSEYLKTIKINYEQFKSYKYLDDLENRFRIFLEMANLHSKNLKYTNSLMNLVRTIRNGMKKLNSTSNLAGPDLHVKTLHSWHNELSLQENRCVYLIGMIQKIRKNQSTYQTIDFEIDEMRMQFDTLMLKAGGCPLCGSKNKGNNS